MSFFRTYKGYFFVAIGLASVTLVEYNLCKLSYNTSSKPISFKIDKDDYEISLEMKNRYINFVESEREPIYARVDKIDVTDKKAKDYFPKSIDFTYKDIFYSCILLEKYCHMTLKKDEGKFYTDKVSFKETEDL